MAGPVLLAAGGTGGHLFPAAALAEVLAGRGHQVRLATDERVAGYGRDFPAEAVHRIPSATFAGGAVARLKAGLRLGTGLAAAAALIVRHRPSVAVGFGGYPTLPPMIAATLLRVPTVVHEANAVLGRANRLLAPRVSAIAAATAAINVREADRAKVRLTGNPVRAAVRALAGAPFEAPAAGGPLRLLVFGGSQGARYLSDAVPAALEKLAADVRRRIVLTQQCRPEDLDRVRAACARIGVALEAEPFFKDMPDRIAKAQLVVCRSGASTVTELAVIGRPAIMIPLPHALDQDQRENARILADAGGGWMFLEKDLSAERLGEEIGRLMAEPGRLAAAAAAARGIGRPDAVERLADLVEAVAARALPGKGKDAPA